jgi:hypothetical protein
MTNKELIPKGDGTFFAPKRKREDGSEYIPAEYQNVDKWCTCKAKNKYCTEWTLHHDAHICSNCWCLLSYHVVRLIK